MSVTDSQTEHRSVSRGRQPFSTGRGGVGNIRRPSAVSPSTDTRPDSGPDDFSQTRGRELKVSSTHQPFSTGRGGVGNMTSPSRDPQNRSVKEKEVIKGYQNSQVGAPVSSGRGGLGNISRSRPSDAAVGNTVKNGSFDEKHEPEDDIKKEYHSIGQGGNAIISSETLRYTGDGKQQSTSPGGVGKIVSETIKNSEAYSG